MNEITSVSLRYLGISIAFVLILLIFWNDELAISRLGIILAVAALLVTLWYDQIKDAKSKENRKRALTVYKRDLLFKLIGTLQIIHWSLFSYLSYRVSIVYPTTLQIGNLSVGEFQKIQFDSYKIYYEEIQYFSISDIVPIEIKEDLDWLNLDAEKLINFLPVSVGLLNHTILSRYTTRLFKILRWAIKNEDNSYEVCRHSKEVLEWIEMLLKLKDMEAVVASEEED